MNYKIYYEDGVEWVETVEKRPMSIGVRGPGHPPFSSHSVRGVIAIVQGDPTVGWYICTGADYYIQRDDRWYGIDFFAMIEYLDELRLIDYGVGWKRVKQAHGWTNVDMVGLKAFIEGTGFVLFGRMVSSDEYYKIMQKAEDDREYATRAGVLPGHTTPFKEFKQDYSSKKATD